MRHTYILAMVVSAMLCACSGSDESSSDESSGKEPKLLGSAPDYCECNQCTVEVGSRLHPNSVNRAEAQLREHEKKARTDFQAIESDVHHGMIHLNERIKNAPRNLPLLRKGRFPQVPVNVTVRFKKGLAPNCPAKTRKADNYTYITCEVVPEFDKSGEITRNVPFDGLPRTLAGMIVKGLAHHPGNHKDDGSFGQHHFYANGNFIPYGKFLRGSDGKDPIVMLLRKLVANPKAVKKAGPWVRKIAQGLTKDQRTGLNRRLLELWHATRLKYSGVKKANFGRMDPMCLMLYQRAKASKIGEDMIRIYRIWLAALAQDIEADQAGLWIHEVQEDVRKLRKDKSFYKRLVQGLK